MQIDILTIFPDMFTSPFAESIVRRAQDGGKVSIQIHDLRDWTTDNHRSVDDRPYGGGAGMVMRVDVIDKAVCELKSNTKNLSLKSKSSTLTPKPYPLNPKVILLDTKGPFYTQQKAQELSKIDHLIFIAGHYEGVDHRVHDHIVDEVISIGPYVLTGGELPTMVIVDSIVRLLPGVISEESLREESYQESVVRSQKSENLPTTHYPLPTTTNQLQTNYEAPQYTRPADYKGWKVPEILLQGNHAEIEKWRQTPVQRS